MYVTRQLEVDRYRQCDIDIISFLPISIFVIQNLSDIDVLYCSALWPTQIFHYRPLSSQ